MEGFNALLNEYIRRISYKDKYPVSDYDLIFSNVMVNGPIWTIIDYEWTYGKCIPPRELVWRALYCYRLEDRKREKFDPKPVYKRLGLSDDDIKMLLEEEYAFQKYVTGNRKSMIEIWKQIGRKVIVPKELNAKVEAARPADTLQIYLDEGNGYSEDDSIFPEEQYDDNNTVELDIRVDSQCRVVRVDPAFAPCLVTIADATWNGESLSDNDVEVSIHPVNGEWISDDSMVFDSEDPNIEFGLTGEGLNVLERNHLKLKLITTIIPGPSAAAIVDSIAATHQEEKKKPAENLVKKIGKKNIQMREDRYFRDDEE
jgi:hypothetical protein